MTENNETLVRKRAIRAGNRGVVTKLTKEAEQLLSELDEGEIEVQNQRRGRIKTICSILDEKKLILKELDELVISLCEVEDIEREVEEADEIMMRILEIQGVIYNIDKVKVKSDTIIVPEESEGTSHETVLESNSHNSNNQTAGQSPVLTTQVRSKLPKLVLAKFKGDITQFHSFWDRFQNAVHNNPTLSTIDKFNYLSSLLEGRALRAIQGLSITEANYKAAVDLLQQRFGKSQAIISAHMEELMKIPSCNGDKANQLRFLYDKVSVHVRGLESLGVASSQYGSLLIPIIMAKLPTEIRLQIARKTTDEVWEISALLDLLSREVEAREVSDTIKTNIDNRKPQFPRLPAATAMAAQSGRDTKSIQCAYCQEFHFSASCDRITDPNERKNILRRDNRCFVCLSKSHRSNKCDPKKSCRRCNGNHHQSICPKSHRPPTLPSDHHRNDNVRTTNPEEEQSTNASTTVSQSTTATTKSRQRVLLQTAVTYAFANGKASNSVPVRVLLDSGSQRTYITDSLKKRLGLVRRKTETVNLNTFGDERFTKQRCDLVDFILQAEDGHLEISALSFPKICSPLSTTIDLNHHQHLHNLKLSDLNILKGNQSTSHIDVLIGADYYYEVITGNMIRGQSGPIAISSRFGWVICGPTKDLDTPSEEIGVNLSIDAQPSSTNTLYADETELISAVRRFWEIETLGITDEKTTDEEFLPGIEYKEDDGRYEVKLPWKNECMPKSDSYVMCAKRLYQLRSRLRQDKALMKEYDEVIKEQLSNQIIEPALDHEENSHFLPHHGVIRHDKDTTKLRVVFDGSAKSSKDDISLNDCLNKGPNLTPHLFDTIVKFRSYPIGIVADIEKAFHQVQIAPDDRKMLKFLWFDNIQNDHSTIKLYQFRRLPFGLTPSPAILSTTIHHHLNQHSQEEPGTVSLLRDSLYVDDFAGGADNDSEALRVFHTSRDLMSKGGFNLRKWQTNSPALRDTIIKQRDADNLLTRATSSESVRPGHAEPENNSEVKLLGIKWNTDNDVFRLDLKDVVQYAHSLPATKRSVLKLSAKVFDPIGLVTPFTVNLKILFQTLCTTNVNWDDELEGQALATWNILLKEFDALNDIHVPRCYFHHKDDLAPSYQLHGFCDASEKAFAAAVYLRTEPSDGVVEVNLVAAKTRVAPIKGQSIPRLELLGATILARLMNSVLQSLKSLRATPQVTLWTDSFTTLCWIRNNKQWKQYIQNRVIEIRKWTDPSQWRHCPGNLNPADLPSRGCSGKQLLQDERWLRGPNFLQCSEDQWPENPMPTAKDFEAANVDIVKHPYPITHSLTGLTTNANVDIQIDKIIDAKRFSSKARLLRVTALLFRFVTRLRKRPVVYSGDISAEEFRVAERLWIRSIQRSSFTDEIHSIQKNQHNPLVNQLRLYIDESQLIRCQGRLCNSSLPESAKNPILLPTKHHFTDVIVRECHLLVHHDGVRETLNCVRQRYWIPRGREAVKRVVRRCVTCRIFEGHYFATPHEPPLPSARVSDDPPFSNTGVDFAGPLFTATDKGNQKVYICLFTCATTRAVHLELVDNLTVTSFFQAFRRFAARRGLPTRLLSDNAKTFKGASKEVKTIMRSNEVYRKLAVKGVKWDFIIERSPWQGGFWERMVRSTKRCLKKILGRTSLTFEALRTILVEIETTINNRPFTYVYSDDEGISYPLTPSQLVNGRQISVTPNERQFEILSTNQSLTKRAKYHKRLLDQFTKRWRNEYLLSLREASSSHSPSPLKIAVGDVVVLKNDGVSRAFWKLATVQELIKSTDGAVRAAKVRVVTSDRGKATIMRRSIQHLIPLELQLNNKQDDITETDITHHTETDERDGRPPRRVAAIVGEIQRKDRTK